MTKTKAQIENEGVKRPIYPKSTKLQRLAGQENWEMAQVKNLQSSCTRLLYINDLHPTFVRGLERSKEQFAILYIHLKNRQKKRISEAKMVQIITKAKER